MRFIILYASLILCLFACGKTEDIPEVEQGGVRHLEVNGKPFLMLGAQLRTDFFLQLDKRTPDELDPYFELAANMNVMVVQMPICWKDIEPNKDSYSETLVEKYIELCERHNLKLELLWFGGYMCGYSVEGYIPDYVLYNTSEYPELKPSADFQGWLGKHYYLKPNTPQLVEREEKAIQYMMEAIYNYDNSHGKKHTVIGIQVENEPDMLATRHNQAHGYTPEQLWPDLIDMLDRLGQAVKNSSYDCYTRVNQTTTYTDHMKRSAEIVATKGIDYVGVDPYENTITQIDGKLRALRKIEGNYGHISENGGEYANNDLLALKALTLGCGYEIFEVITTPHPYLVDWTLRGVYNPDFTPKDHTQRIVDAFRIYKDAWVDLATAETKDIIGFNLKSDNGLEQTSETQKTAHVRVKWQTTSRGVAFAVEYDSHLTVASTQNDMMEFSNIQISSIEKGHYNMNGTWVPDGNIVPDRNQLVMEPCTVYRVIFTQ
ncbi:MAG: DUF4978 domain-containing protein [Mangrovibacterium sp.]